MFTILMMSGKMDTLNLLKIRISWSKVYDVIIAVYDVISKILSRDWNCIVVAVMWRKFANSSISMRDVIVTSIL